MEQNPLAYSSFSNVDGARGVELGPSMMPPMG